VQFLLLLFLFYNSLNNNIISSGGALKIHWYLAMVERRVRSVLSQQPFRIGEDIYKFERVFCLLIIIYVNYHHHR
jgi:hypothetical protein